MSVTRGAAYVTPWCQTGTRARAAIIVRVLAVLYDIHGNLPALRAVLADARAAGADRFLLGGDYAAFGAWPRETVEALRELPDAVWIRGNWERWLGRPRAAPDDPTVAGAGADCRRALGDAVVAELARLPDQIARDGVRYTHASPVSDVRSFAPEPPGDAGEDAELLGGAVERRVVFGHTHLAFRRATSSGVELINPGSVGLPLDGDPRAAYALVAPDGALEHRRIGYAQGESAAALRARASGAWTETIARRLETARM